jgi:hypothetical protein
MTPKKALELISLSLLSPVGFYAPITYPNYFPKRLLDTECNSYYHTCVKYLKLD